MWIILSFISALCLGCYDISKKIALRENRVIDVLTLSVCISTVLLSVPWCLSRVCPEAMTATPFYVPQLDLAAHGLVVVKSMIVLSSWVFAYISLKHLPLSVVSPMQATRPMWTLVGALLLFGERLNSWQWLGVCLAIGSVFIFSFSSFGRFKRGSAAIHVPQAQYTASANTRAKGTLHGVSQYTCRRHTALLSLALAILIGACSGLYDKYLMRSYDHNAVQVYYTFYQALMLLVGSSLHALPFGRFKSLSPFGRLWGLLPFGRLWGLLPFGQFKRGSAAIHVPQAQYTASANTRAAGTLHTALAPIILISLFLIISDNVYMLALQDPDSLIAVVSTIRRGGAVIGFAYGLIFLKEPDPWKKLLCMLGILAGLICLAIGSM